MNKTYANLLKTVIENGELINTRNHDAYSHIMLPPVIIDKLPLVTVRRTAWKKALREMEWFFSGESECPEELLDWWEGQLSKYGDLIDGYPLQFRSSTSTNENGIYWDFDQVAYWDFDQVAFIRESLATNPNSRRLVMTTWNPGEMANITKTNGNPNTPTCCHGIVIQFFVRHGKLYMTHYQRSADMLLGVPHNFIQYWAMLLYFAHHAGLEPGSIQWLFGDAHVYTEESHISTALEIVAKAEEMPESDLRMVYTPTSIEFKADDFTIVGDIPKPLVTGRPKLL